MDETAPYSIKEAAALTGFSETFITKLFEHERGVIIWQVPRKRKRRKTYRTIKIPRRVFERVLRRLTVR